MLPFVSGQMTTMPPAPPVIANVRSDVTVMSRQVDGNLACIDLSVASAARAQR